MKFSAGKTLILFAWMALPVSAQTSVGLPAPLVSNVMNAPNPFDSRMAGLMGQTRISYTLTTSSDVDVTIYDLGGHRVRQWRFVGQSGDNAFFWDGTNETGQKVSKGGYIARIQITSAEGSASTLRKIGVLH